MASQQLFTVLRRRRGLRFFFAGMLVSRTGDFFNVIAIAWLTLEIAGPKELGLLFAAAGVAGAVTAPLAGYWLDRFGLRRLLFLDNATRAVLAAMLPLLMWHGNLTIPVLFAFTLVSGALGTITELGQSVVIPMLVEEGELDAANTLISVIWEVSTWIGPALAGVTVEFAGIVPALFIDAGTFGVMALVSLAMPARIPSDGEASTPRAHILSGFRLIRATRPVTVTVTTVLCLLMLAGLLEVFFPFFTKEMLHTGPAGYGALVSLVGFGALVGAVYVSPWLGRRRLNLAIGWTFAARLVLLTPLAFTHSYALAAAVLTVGSVLDGALTTVNRSVLQHQIPLHLRGRVLGAARALTAGGYPLGSAGAGLLMTVLSPGALVLIGVVAFLPVTGWISRSRLAKANAFAEPEPAPAASAAA